MFKNSHLLIILTLKRYECGDGVGGGAIRLKKGDKKTNILHCWKILAIQ